MEDVPFGPETTTLLCDVSTGQPRPIVPTSWRRKVFDSVHGLSHPSVRSTRKLIASKFIWNGLQKQVGLWAKQCVACQSAKIQTHVKAPLEKFEVPQRRFDHIHVDLVGPLPPSNGFTHLFTIIDHTSRWPEAIPLSNTSAASCAQALVSHWMQDLESRWTFPQIEDHSSPLSCGQPFHSCWVPRYITPRPTIPNPMVCWRGSTAT